jgi:hypothetical protein
MRSFHKTSVTIFLLMLPLIFWAGNAIVGRLMVGVIPPLTLNFLRVGSSRFYFSFPSFTGFS